MPLKDFQVGQQAAHASFDVENFQEKCTPYTLAILSEQFALGEMLAECGLSAPDHRNADGLTVRDIAKKHKLEKVLQHLDRSEKRMSQIAEP